MNKKIKAIAAATALVIAGAGLSACDSDADVASRNLSKDSDNFKVVRQVVLYNAITDKNILEETGFCSLGNSDSSDRVSVTCRVGSGYTKNIYLKSNNTLVFVNQLESKNVSTSFHKVILKPSTIVPDLELR